MQSLNWDDLRYLLAVHRGGTYSAAARYLGVDDTTVARRLKSLQAAAGTDLVQRLADNSIKLTQAGCAVLAHAETMEREAEAIRQTLGEGASKAVGTVRITSVPIVINRLLVPAVPKLLRAHPDLAVEVVADARDFSLTRREADLAIRLARPTSGGTKVITRRIGTLIYGAFAHTDAKDDEAETLEWITFEDTMNHLPQARWIAGLNRTAKSAISMLRVNDAETALEAAACGLGKTLLPRSVGSNDPRLRQIAVSGLRPDLGREVWLLSHAEQKDLKHIRAAIEWIETIGW